jgi:adenosylcobinamide-GDP ribazoletransferase
MGVTMGLVPYARDDGMATGFAGRSVAPAAVTAVGALAVVAITLGGWAGPATALAAAGGFAAVVAFAVRRVGGYTGDVLGAAGVVAETVGLLVAAARW